MKYKKMFLILIMICIFVSLSSVYASENITLTTNQLTLHDENDELSINEVNIDNNDDLNKMKNLSENENYDEFEEINLNQNDILSQDNDNELSASLTKTQISISDSTITLSETSIYKPTLTVEVKTTSENLVNTGKVYFEIYKNSYNKITTSEIGVHDGVAYYQYDLNLNPGKYRSVAHYLDSSKKYESSSYEFYLIINNYLF